MQKIKFNPNFIPYTNINLKWMKDLNIKTETMELFKENIGIILNDIAYTTIT